MILLKKEKFQEHIQKVLTYLERNFAKYNKTKYAVSVSSGTTALHLAIACLNLRNGSEVLVSTTTNIATGLAITHNNLDSKIYRLKNRYLEYR